jgi:hypothetical protein
MVGPKETDSFGAWSLRDCCKSRVHRAIAFGASSQGVIWLCYDQLDVMGSRLKTILAAISTVLPTTGY